MVEWADNKKKDNNLLIAKCFISLHPISVPLIKKYFQ